MALTSFFFMGLNTGATKYTSYSLEGAITEMSTTSGANGTFDLSPFGGTGKTKSEVGKLASYTQASKINNTTIILNFDYEITSVNILAKNGSQGVVSRHDEWVTLENNTIRLKPNVPVNLDNNGYYVLVLINTPLGVTKYPYTENLTHITSNALSAYEENTNFDITYTADENYIINTLTSNIGTITISSDKKNATLSGVATSEINVTGSATLETVNATYNLSNISTSGLAIYIKNSTVTINFSTRSGYAIDKLESTLGTITIADDKLSAKLTLIATQDFTVTGSASTNTVNANYNLTNISTTGSSTYTKNKDVTIKFTSYSGYIIDSLESTLGTITIAQDKLSATLALTTTQDFTVTGSASEDFGLVSITGTFTNCVCNYSDGEQIKPNKPIAITANEGYVFKEVFTYYSGHFTHAFEVSGDNKKLYTNSTATVVLNDNYIAVREGKSIGGFTNLYKTNNSELNNLSKVRFYDDTDYGSYILGCYVLPFTLPDDIIGDTTSIILGKYDSNVPSTSLLDYILHIDYGSIKVPAKYNNVYDYLDTNCILRLPFFESIPIENQYVIGQTLHIEYVIDLYSGLCGVNVTSTFNNGIVISATTNITTQIPFIQRTTDNVINQLSTNLLNPIKECVVEVTHNISYNPSDTLFGKPTKIVDTLNNYTGYIEVENINLTTSATTDEIDEIKKLLKSGIFIN